MSLQPHRRQDTGLCTVTWLHRYIGPTRADGASQLAIDRSTYYFAAALNEGLGALRRHLCQVGVDLPAQHDSTVYRYGKLSFARCAAQLLKHHDATSSNRPIATTTWPLVRSWRGPVMAAACASRSAGRHPSTGCVVRTRRPARSAACALRVLRAQGPGTPRAQGRLAMRGIAGQRAARHRHAACSEPPGDGRRGAARAPRRRRAPRPPET